MQNEVNDLVTDQVDSPSVDQTSVDTPFVPEPDIDWDDPAAAMEAVMNDGEIDAALNLNRGIAPSTDEVSEAPVVEVEEQHESEDDSQVETLEDDSAEDTPTEEEDSDEDYDEAPPGELNVIDVSDLDDSDVFEVELHGKKQQMNWTAIQNQLKRSESASQQSREAKAAKEAAEQLEAELQAERQYIRANVAQEQMHPALQTKLAEVQRKGEEAQKLYTEQSLDFPFAEKAYNNAVAEYQQMTQEYQSYVNQQHHYKASQEQKKLRDFGLGHLIADQAAKESFTSFLDKTVSPDTQANIRSSAELTSLAEDARKWRESQEKGTKKSVKAKPARKSLKGGGTSSAQKRAAQKPQNTHGWVNDGQVDPETDAVLDAYFANR